MKQCKVCLVEKPQQDFENSRCCKECFAKRSEYWRQHRKNYLKSYSKSDKFKQSVASYQAKKKAEDPDAWRARNKLARYNMTLEDYGRILEAQKGLCGICERDIRQKNHIDHCHETGEIRGLLCHVCNQGLGAFADSIPGLEAAIEYLKRAEANPTGLKKKTNIGKRF